MNRRPYSRIIPFGSESYIVRHKRLWGIIDVKGCILLPIIYTRVHWFEGGYAGIQVNDKWGLVDANGHITIEPQYDSMLYYAEHKACCVKSGQFMFVLDGQGKIIMKVEDGTVKFEGNKIKIHSQNGEQLFNTDGSPFSKIHKHIMNIGERFTAFDYEEDNNKVCRQILIKADGEEVIMPNFKRLVSFSIL